MQLIAETVSRKDTLFDPSPIVLAKNIFSDKEMLQNMSYMSLETFMKAGVSSSDPNLKRRMMVCGVLSFTNSNAILGYAVAMVDQLAGYYTYSQVTKRFEESRASKQPKSGEKQGPKLVLLPIVSEQTSGG